MKLTGIFNSFSNKAKLSLLSRKNAKEVSELCEDICKNYSCKNVEIKLKDRNNVNITARHSENNYISIDMDFKNNIQKQIQKSKSYVLTILHPYRESVQEIRGTIDGVIKRAKTITTERNQDGSSYVKNTYYQNFVSGNTFLREETPNGVKFYRNVDGDLVEMFKK